MPASATGVAPFPAIGDFGMCFDFLLYAPAAWDCLDKGQGEIPTRLAGASSDGTGGCRHLLRGIAMVFGLAPLRASGETHGPDSWTGRRRRLDAVPLLEGVALFARGVPDGGVGYWLASLCSSCFSGLGEFCRVVLFLSLG
jgi:hypothetical protein